MAIAIGLGMLVVTVLALIGAFSVEGKDRSAMRFWGIFIGGSMILALLTSAFK